MHLAPQPREVQVTWLWFVGFIVLFAVWVSTVKAE